MPEDPRLTAQDDHAPYYLSAHSELTTEALEPDDCTTENSRLTTKPSLSRTGHTPWFRLIVGSDWKNSGVDSAHDRNSGDADNRCVARRGTWIVDPILESSHEREPVH